MFFSTKIASQQVLVEIRKMKLDIYFINALFYSACAQTPALAFFQHQKCTQVSSLALGCSVGKQILRIATSANVRNFYMGKCNTGS